MGWNGMVDEKEEGGRKGGRRKWIISFEIVLIRTPREGKGREGKGKERAKKGLEKIRKHCIDGYHPKPIYVLMNPSPPFCMQPRAISHTTLSNSLHHHNPCTEKKKKNKRERPLKTDHPENPPSH